MAIEIPQWEDFKLKSTDKLRYADTDRQGHVNNANFSTFYETGRTEIFHKEGSKIFDSKTEELVIVNMNINYINEILWPGVVETGSKIIKVGNSSIHLYQAIFQDGECKSTSLSVIVLIDKQTRRPKSISEESRRILLNH